MFDLADQSCATTVDRDTAHPRGLAHQRGDTTVNTGHHAHRRTDGIAVRPSADSCPTQDRLSVTA